jgi:ectoine hydroxylase-related dioxygenase (phytanoyl-CoA dioxygenase family)
MSNPKILYAVESLIGGEIFPMRFTTPAPKVPKVAAGAVPWHQDKSYWPDANSNPVTTVWIPLVDSTPENGCLHVWPRTHKKQLLKHMSTPNNSDHVRWSVDLRYQPTDQDRMPQHGAGFLARSRKYPERVADLEDWLANRPEHEAAMSV